jgi:AcrR family transcriptional regulator
MAWDTARTKQLLLDAAVAEFAEHGPQGARVDRIAQRAEVNKERIYQYFGNKRRLFDAVLEAELGKLAAAVPLTAERAADLGEYAGRVFDYHRAHPHFLRLLRWEGLQDEDTVAAQSERMAHYTEKLAAVAAAQRAGAVTSDFEPGEVFYAVFALAAWWFTVPQVVRMIMSDSNGTPESQRAALVRMVRRLTSAEPSGVGPSPT